MFLVVLLTKFFVFIINSVKNLFCTEECLSKYDYCKKAMKKNFNKNLVMSAEEEERF